MKFIKKIFSSLKNDISDSLVKQKSDTEIVIWGCLALFVVAIIFYFIDQTISKSIIINLIFFISMLFFGTLALRNFKNGLPFYRCFLPAIVPIIIMILMGIFLK